MAKDGGEAVIAKHREDSSKHVKALQDVSGGGKGPGTSWLDGYVCDDTWEGFLKHAKQTLLAHKEAPTIGLLSPVEDAVVADAELRQTLRVGDEWKAAVATLKTARITTSSFVLLSAFDAIDDKVELRKITKKKRDYEASVVGCIFRRTSLAGFASALLQR